MNLKNLRIPWSMVVAAMGIAAGSGGTVALAKGQITINTDKIESLESDARVYREQVIRMQTVLEQVSKTVERIERKLDRDGASNK